MDYTTDQYYEFTPAANYVVGASDRRTLNRIFSNPHQKTYGTDSSYDSGLPYGDVSITALGSSSERYSKDRIGSMTVNQIQTAVLENRLEEKYLVDRLYQLRQEGDAQAAAAIPLVTSGSIIGSVMNNKPGDKKEAFFGGGPSGGGDSGSGAGSSSSGKFSLFEPQLMYKINFEGFLFMLFLILVAYCVITCTKEWLHPMSYRPLAREYVPPFTAYAPM
jgi:hypothetical protein